MSGHSKSHNTNNSFLTATQDFRKIKMCFRHNLGTIQSTIYTNRICIRINIKTNI